MSEQSKHYNIKLFKIKGQFLTWHELGSTYTGI